MWKTALIKLCISFVYRDGIKGADVITFPQNEDRTLPEDDSEEEKDGDDKNDDDDSAEDDVDICTLPPIFPGPMGCLAFIPKYTYSTRYFPPLYP